MASQATEPKTSERNNLGSLANATKPESPPSYSRDPDFYFEDGSSILLVQDVLFKVHASLLKAQSQVFQDMFAMPSGNAVNGIEGSSDQYPIVIPQVKHPQFRNLLKMIYSPASSAFHASLKPSSDGDCSNLENNAWDIFTFYLDVATLCHRFGMDQMEQWAKKMLQMHISFYREEVARGANADPGSLLDAIQHAMTTQDHRLIRDIQHLAYHYICASEHDLESRGLIALFRTPGLRENHPSIFGCIFSVFLREEHPVWERESFTKVDRMALFSCQVRLSSIPESFKKDIRSPLFEKLSSLDHVRKIIALDDLCETPPPCSHGCDEKIMNLWRELFEEEYYEGGVECASLAILPEYRAEFVVNAQQIRCCQGCSTRFIDQLDEDIELVYVRLGEYYREIE